MSELRTFFRKNNLIVYVRQGAGMHWGLDSDVVSLLLPTRASARAGARARARVGTSTGGHGQNDRNNKTVNKILSVILFNKLHHLHVRCVRWTRREWKNVSINFHLKHSDERENIHIVSTVLRVTSNTSPQC